MATRSKNYCYLLLFGALLETPVSLAAQGLLLTQDVKVKTREATGKPLVHVLNEIKARYKISFLFEDKTVEGKVMRGDLRYSGSVEAVLDQLLPGLHLKYRKIAEGVFVISGSSHPDSRPETPPEASLPARGAPPAGNPQSQTQAVASITLTGRVTGTEGGAGLPGVAVVLKGTTSGTVTDGDGSYKLTIPDEAADGILVFSFIGFISQEVPIERKAVVNVALATDTKALDEVVVVGYGTQRKKDITGSVASVPVERLKDQPVPNVEQAIKGQVAGVQVTQNSGSPSGGVNIKIRGTSSITAGNEPLFVIDGFPVTAGDRGQGSVANGNPLNNINPNDIESIDILKDASATAIYGSRGSNGVVIITTKSGKSGKARISLDAYAGIQTITRKIDVLNAEEMAGLHIDSRNNGWLQSGGNPATPNEQRGRFTISPFWFDPQQWQPTDYQDEIFRQGTIRNFNLSATGGTENIRYALSGGYLSNKGIVIASGMERYSFRSNIDASVNDKIKIGFKFNPSYTVNDQVRSDGDFNSGLVHQALLVVPNIGPYDPNEYGGYSNQNAARSYLGQVGGLGNPVARALEDEYTLDQGRVLGNTFLEWEITNGLRFRTMVGIDAAFNRTHVFNSSINGLTGAAPSTIPSGTASSSQELDWLNENLLTYEKTLGGKHRLTALAGYSAQRNDFRLLSTSGTQYPNDDVPYVNAAGIINGGTEQRAQWSLLSYFTRLNYAFADRYLVTATLRRDGSSRFGSNRKYGNFPSAAFAWLVSEERFMKPFPFISSLKIRASYGVSGNNSIGNYTHLAATSNVAYVTGSGQVLVNATRAAGLGNPDLTWETKASYNFGLDVSVLRNRIDFTAEYYRANTDGLLLSVNIPSVSGFGTRIENIGEVENSGVELALNTRNFVGNFQWNSNVNVSFNRNRVLALGGSAKDFIDGTGTRNVVGQPLSRFYQRVTDGIFNTQAEIDAHVPQDNNPRPGDRRFKDVNGDGKVDNNDRDFVGDPNPDFTFGVTNNFSFKGFELSILVNGSYGNDIYYNTLFAASNLNGNINNNGIVRNRWRSADNPGDGNIPKALFGFSTLPDVGSDFYVFDGSYLRVSNITLAYNVPAGWISKARLSNARLYVSGQNLATFTRYPGFDPENAIGGGSLSFGFDNGLYPSARILSLGCNLTF